MGQDGPVSEFLVVYLDSIDERLLDYLDEDEELRLEVVKRLRYYATALLEGSIARPRWPRTGPTGSTWSGAFVAVYAPGEIEELEEAATFMDDPSSTTPR